MIDIPKSVEQNFLSKSVSVSAVLDGDMYPVNSYRYSNFLATKFICSCEESNGEVQDVKVVKNGDFYSAEKECKYCGKSIYSYGDICTDAAHEKATSEYWRAKKANKTHKSQDIMFFQRTEDGNGIECYVGKTIVALDETDEFKPRIKKEVDISHYARFVPGKPFEAIKIMKRSNKDVNVFEAFNINSRTSYDKFCIYEDASCFMEFFEKNIDFMQKCGLYNAFKYASSTRKFNFNGFFITFLALTSEYPVLELLIKMGYTKLFTEILFNVLDSGSKANIQARVKDLNKLLTDSTKGSLALRIPQYIGQYLKEKSATLDEFLDWCDIYEQDNLSKEQFEKVINSHQYLLCLNSQSIKHCADVMKYGYSFTSLVNYLYKHHKSSLSSADIRHGYWRYNDEGYIYSNNITLLRDYLQMCDLMGVKPDKTPKDIKKVHDAMSLAYKAKENALNDEKFNKLANSIVEYLKKDDDEKETKMEKEYEIVFPRSTRDFINEGQQQHNCVGSYCRNVLNGYNIIFFIRKKENPDESYITGEFVRGGLGQLMYKNNVPVHDKDMREFCRVLCNKLNRGLNSGKILNYNTKCA